MLKAIIFGLLTWAVVGMFVRHVVDVQGHYLPVSFLAGCGVCLYFLLKGK